MGPVATEERVIQIPESIRDDMIAHALRCFPEEACGLVGGTDGRAERFYPMRNADRSAVTYRLDPQEQLEVFEEIERNGWELFGIFHSHTHTEAYPSETDLRQAFYPEAHYLMVSLAERDNLVLRGFTIREGEVEEQEVRIT
jgi:[CysO sulfur-carrier protein]-S-L-cysteine hydrolase